MSPLTPTQTRLLASLYNHGPLWRGMLGRYHRTVKALVDGGFAKWDRDDDLCITPTGRAHMKERAKGVRRGTVAADSGDGRAE